MEKPIEIKQQPSSELFRPRLIESNHLKLRPEVGLFGTCGSPASTWRRDIFIPELEKRGLSYFNPQVEEWTPDMAQKEAEHLAMDEVVVFPISKETHGYASLAEGGWAILGALMRGQKLGIYIEEDDAMPEDAKRARMLFKTLSVQIQREYPVFQFEESMKDLAQWAAIVMKERVLLRNSKIKETRRIELPNNTITRNTVGIFGTAGSSFEWKKTIKDTFEARGIDYFDSHKEDWKESDIHKEIEHKLNDKVLLQIITRDTESFGSLAESGLLALSAFVRGQAYGIYIESYPGNPKSDTNRARTLVKAHIRELTKEFPGIVYLSDSVEDLTRFAVNMAQ